MPETAITFVDEDIIFAEDTFYKETQPGRNRAYNNRLPAGAAAWCSGSDGRKFVALEFVCPCGCGAVGGVNVSIGSKEQHAWLWDGNKEKPTLTPSIQQTTPCRWHGFLTAGIFRQC
jgi:hypothetical protein